MGKRLCAAILAIGMIVSLEACGTASEPAEDAAATSSAPSGTAEYESAEGKQIKVFTSRPLYL